ncbi:MAG: hypothetical protein AAFY59_02565 [Pseudomonadota bacterium]
MQHGKPPSAKAVQRAFSDDPLADRIAALSAEYLEADAGTRRRLAAEFDALLAGEVIRLTPSR